ncbi:RagB/SusD family nutrient uptake outer membrane protein [Flavobacterium adhaerens]|uniref:RagB/SusD family nutrient uptake outer membrane protein n=1 Tax=Flavobacterium adhaerens TaxID=3149043 RepID=UPI0032B34FE6
MKLNKIKKSAICLSLLATISCTNNFEEINTNPNGFSKEQLSQDYNQIKSLYAPVFNKLLILDVTWMYQIQQNLQADLWSGYLTTPIVFGPTNNHDYALNDGWNGYAWDTAYLEGMANLVKIEEESKGKYDQFYAWGLILKVATMHRITDMYGPIVYSKYGVSDGGAVTYDSQKDVYTQFFKELDFAVTELTERVDAGEASSFGSADKSTYAGDYKKWVKFANSLRLRLAIRISKVDPALAKTEAEKAVNHSIGVMTTKDDIMAINSPQNLHVIDVIANSWKGIMMGADVESIWGGYEDPRMPIYFTTAPKFAGEYKGVRTGIVYPSSATYADHSTSNPKGPMATGNVVWMTTAEVYFLRAEGAVRGWNMNGTAKELYELGISTSFDQAGASGAAAYIADNTKMPKDYVDYVNSANNIAAVNKVTVAWNDAATNEVKLQKIITQKWIANYPEGQEAWSEWRRTGYPKLFPISNNKSGGVISTEYGVRRLPFAQSEKNTNPAGVATGVEKLGGADNGATRLWWDTTTANF